MRKVKVGNINEGCDLDSITKIAEAYFSGNLEGLLSIEATEEKIELPTRNIEGQEVIHAGDFQKFMDENPRDETILYLTGNFRLYNKIRQPYNESTPFIDREISGVAVPYNHASLVNLPRLKEITDNEIDYLIIGNIVAHELGHDLGLLDYYKAYGHEPYCLMIQSSGNIKKLYSEIRARRGFCEECRNTLLKKQVPAMQKIIKSLRKNLFLLPEIKYFDYAMNEKVLHDIYCGHKPEKTIELAFRHNPKKFGYKLCDILEEKYTK